MAAGWWCAAALTMRRVALCTSRSSDVTVAASTLISIAFWSAHAGGEKGQAEGRGRSTGPSLDQLEGYVCVVSGRGKEAMRTLSVCVRRSGWVLRYLGAAAPVLAEDDMEYLRAVATVHSVGLLSFAVPHITDTRSSGQFTNWGALTHTE